MHSALAHVGGLAGLYILPVHLASPTYMSENALQPGLHEVSLGRGLLSAEVRGLLTGYNATTRWVCEQLRGVAECAARTDDAVAAWIFAPRADTSGCVALSAHLESPLRCVSLQLVLIADSTFPVWRMLCDWRSISARHISLVMWSCL